MPKLTSTYRTGYKRTNPLNGKRIWYGTDTVANSDPLLNNYLPKILAIFFMAFIFRKYYSNAPEL